MELFKLLGEHWAESTIGIKSPGVEWVPQHRAESNRDSQLPVGKKPMAKVRKKTQILNEKSEILDHLTDMLD